MAEQPDEEAGTPINPHVVEKDFRRVREMPKLSDRLTPYSMRRIFASFHIGAELHPKQPQQQTGYSSINVTPNTYAKWWNPEDRAAADALGGLVAGEVAAKAL